MKNELIITSQRVFPILKRHCEKQQNQINDLFSCPPNIEFEAVVVATENYAWGITDIGVSNINRQGG